MLKKDNLIRMAETRGEWCVSVYMPVSEADAKQNKKRLRNLMSEAREKLSGLEVEPFKISRMLAPIEMILDYPDFWKDRAEGFAAFFTLDSFVWHSMQYNFGELVVVTDRFHLKPLLRNAAQIGRFYLLALSENQIKLYEASEYEINEVFVKGIPRNLKYFFSSEDEESMLEENDRNTRLGELFGKVDKAVTSCLKNDQAPLILVGDGYLHPVYRESNTYTHLLKTGIGGNVDDLTPKELLNKALPIVKPVFRQRREKAMENYRKKQASGLATDNFSKIFKAAGNGRVKTLFVPVGIQKWGKFDAKTDDLRIHERAKPGDKDLLCVASTRTLRGGGDVFVVLPEQMPDNASIAAVLK